MDMQMDDVVTKLQKNFTKIQWYIEETTSVNYSIKHRCTRYEVAAMYYTK